MLHRSWTVPGTASQVRDTMVAHPPDGFQSVHGSYEIKPNGEITIYTVSLAPTDYWQSTSSGQLWGGIDVYLKNTDDDRVILTAFAIVG